MVRAPKPLSWLATGVLVLGGASVQAQDLLSGGSDLQAEQAESQAEHPAGAYTGVKPGGAEKPAVPATPGEGQATITWPGFQMRLDGSSRVFLQTTAAVAHQMTVSPDKIVIDLGSVKIAGDTNRFPLITQFFNTPVDEVTLKREGSSTKLVLSMRTPVQPTVSSEVAESGFSFLYIDFPAGQYLEDASGGAQASAAPTAKAPAPVAAKPQSAPKPPPAPAHLEGEVGASGQVKVDTSMDDELPPGMGEVKAQPKAKTKVEAKGGFSL